MVTAIRPYYDAAVAVALATVFAIVVALIAPVIVGSNAPNVTVAAIVFVLTSAISSFSCGATGRDQRRAPELT